MESINAEAREWTASGRTARWYEWLLILLLLGLAGGVRAAAVYKCTNPDGSIAYQDLACSEWQQAGTVEIAPAPAYAKSPEYAVERPAAPRSRTLMAARREPQAMSYECRSSDGQVFYRHSSCPHSVAARLSGSGAHQRGASGGGSVPVSSTRVERDEACRQIHAAGAIGRAGREHDEDVSTYERNLGRDPCR
jgi:hypothetical protein